MWCGGEYGGGRERVRVSGGMELRGEGCGGWEQREKLMEMCWGFEVAALR